MSPGNVLDEIIAHKRDELERRCQEKPRSELDAAIPFAPPPRSLSEALREDVGSPRVISEVKKASPSKGLIREDFDPVEIASAYASGGAAAISVLTDEYYFQGHLDYLTRIRERVSVPLLRKDFTLDSYHVAEARSAGADAILLIMAAFPDDAEIAALAAEAEALGMDVLWEVHDREELERLLPLKPKIVGINNRNLRTFEVSLETTHSLLPMIPSEVITVSESGFFKREELDQMRTWGVNAFLIGESLMRSQDPGRALAHLTRPDEGSL